MAKNEIQKAIDVVHLQSFLSLFELQFEKIDATSAWIFKCWVKNDCKANQH